MNKLSLLAISLLSLNASAQSLAGVSALDADRLYSGQAISIAVQLTANEGKKPWCGLSIQFGDGKVDAVRVEDVSGPLVVSHSYALPGKYEVRVEGKAMFRGLNTAGPCEGDAKTASLTVVDKAELAKAQAEREERERRRKEAIEQREAAARKLADEQREAEARKQDLEAREAQLRAREIELKERQLRAREAALKAREDELRRQTEAPPQRARPVQSAPPAPAAPVRRDAGTLDVFK